MTITVTQLNNYVHGLFEVDGVLNDLSVCGEICNVKRSRDGWYFSVKDEGASVDCFCYPATCQEPQNGTMVVIEGRLNYWTKSGRVSFFVRRLTATNNTGAAYLKFLELKEKLQKEGLFDDARKKTVPHCCYNIGVVTSATGAVIHDIWEVAHRRQPFSNVILMPVKVQGVGADVEIARGIQYLDQTDVDVIIVGRGGGSNDDLSVFNSEVLVRAVAACNKPVVSAVGHGVDFTLCDFAADRRAVTPTEAAEFVTLNTSEVKQSIYAMLSRQSQLIARLTQNQKYKVALSTRRIGDNLHVKVDKLRRKVKLTLMNNAQLLSAKLTNAQNKTEKLVARLNASNPAKILQRGYAHVSKNGAKVSSIAQLDVGDTVNITLQDGTLNATVTNKEAKSK